jgi:hypothetical protein
LGKDRANRAAGTVVDVGVAVVAAADHAVADGDVDRTIDALDIGLS